MRFSTISAIFISIAATAVAAPMADPALASGGVAGQCNNSNGCSGTAAGAAGNLSGDCTGDTCSGAASGTTKREVEAVEIEERGVTNGNTYGCQGDGCQIGAADGFASPTVVIPTKQKRQATSGNKYGCTGIHCYITVTGSITAPTGVVPEAPTKVRRDQSLVANASGQATGSCDQNGVCSGNLSGTVDPTY